MKKEDKKVVKKDENKEEKVETKKNEKDKIEAKVVKKKEVKDLNKKQKIERYVMVAILIIIFACTFFLFGCELGASYFKEDKECPKCEKCKDCSKVKNCVKKEEVVSKVDGDVAEIKLFVEEDLPYDDIALDTEEDILNFVNSLSYADEEVRNEFFDNEGKKEALYNLKYFKTAYVLRRMFGYMADSMDPVFISKELILKEMNKVFAIDDNYSFIDVYDLWFGGLGYYLTCAGDVCIANVGMGGVGVGNPHYETKIVSSRKDGDNTIYTLDDYYKTAKSTGTGRDFIYTSKKVGTYEMTFDKYNCYVSSKKIN